MRYLILPISTLALAIGLPAQGPKPVVGKTPPGTGVVKQDKTGKGGPQGKTGKQKTGKQKTGKQETGKEQKKGTEQEPPIPAGSDPADLKAMQSAQDMIKAERRLVKLLKAGKIKGIDRVLPFEEIASWPYEDGLKGMPKKLMKLGGKQVMMTGFMLPIDEVENIKEFLLVQSLWSCCYGQPPDINGTVRVVMQGKKRIDYKFDPIRVIGKFKIKPTIEDGFCVDIYQLETKDVKVIQ